MDRGESTASGHVGRETVANDLRDGELILICDIGGGTSDFSLVRARSVNGELAV